MTREQIAADYAASHEELRGFYAEAQGRKTPEEWAKLAPFPPSIPEDILRPMHHLDETWQGSGPYLAAFGFAAREQAQLGRRLRGASSRV